MGIASRGISCVTVLIVSLGIAACSSGAGSSTAPADSPASGSSGSGTTNVDVTLQEWAVVPAEDSVPTGDVSFHVTNTGPEDVHEFVVLRTDLDPSALPTDATGTVSEDGEGIQVVDEIEDIPVGESQDLTVSLAAGKYVLLCNIYAESEKEAHYQMGMRIAFSVTD